MNLKSFLKYFVIAVVVTLIDLAIVLVFSYIFSKLNSGLVQFCIAIGAILVANIVLACFPTHKTEEGDFKEK